MIRKEAIHKLIDKVEDRDVLRQLLSMIETVIRTNEDKTEPSPDQLKSLHNTYEKSKQGKTYSMSEVKERFEEYKLNESKKLKEGFHKLIDEISDHDVLYVHYESLERHLSSQQNGGDITDELSPEQLVRLEKSIEQGRNGQTIPHAEMKKRIKEWLMK